MLQNPQTSMVTDTRLVDGRQSDRALQVRRGLGRHLHALGYAFMPEMTLANGRRADIMAVAPNGSLLSVEIKSSVADFRSDSKWQDYRDYCDLFAFATLPDVPQDIFPEDVGLFIADAYGAACVRGPREYKLAAARRKALLLSFARGAAHRLMRLEDPDLDGLGGH